MQLDIENVRSRLPGRRIDYYPALGSTMTAASQLASEGAPSGTAVVAEQQTEGKGRHGRSWHSEPEAGLYFSVLLRFPFLPNALPVVTLALGLAAKEAIFHASELVCDLRWPNDLLLNNRKCAGILTQLEDSAIIAGVGVNVNHTAFPADLSQLAISLRMAAGGAAQSKERLLAELLPAIDAYCGILCGQGRPAILDMFAHASSFVSGRRVTVDHGGEDLSGITDGLTEAGFLLVRDDAGRSHTIVAGGVRPCS